MPRYRLTTADGSVLREWDAADAATAEDEAVRTVEEHRAGDPQGAAEYLLTDESGGDVARWGPVAP
ncbi:hypothetical protein SAMN05660690_2789 [Geodermatophilus telluris]|uniref:YD repeat-containing protein n=1 Tax=Geodermatophilus telluris TaxID=1190417 RepID=A0A1G6Q948_9ACTN|nr:hypothetical protein [Geodermatophilus telluris]SDC89032.1 hypothetical protein SAMN05660690_2789 [Geodermatophilus telluris]